MTTLGEVIDNHHRGIVYGQFGVILFFVLACTFNDVLPVCHWLFNCDHRMVH